MAIDTTPRVTIAPRIAEGWSLANVTPPSGLFGANGLRAGVDGRIYVAELTGSRISAVDPDSGLVETVVPFGGPITAPDDLAFDEAGNIYITEITLGQVTMVRPNGTTQVIQGDMPVANPITYHQGRLIAGECRPGARIMELDLNGGAPRVLLADVPMVNAFAFGPDGKLYAPIMGTNEIWRIDVEAGTHEVVAGDLGLPDAVKFLPDGSLVSTQVASGQVLKIDPQSGAREVLAQLTPGLDNCEVLGNRLFVSHMCGGLYEVDLAGGGARAIVERGMQWPLGLACDNAGTLFVAEGAFSYTKAEGGELAERGMLFHPGYSGFTRGVAWAGAPDEWLVTTANGGVHLYRPGQGDNVELASGFDHPMDIARSADGKVVFAEWASGKVHALEGNGTALLAEGLDRPIGVAIADDGSVFVSESGAGRVSKLVGGNAETVLDGLARPEGLAIHQGKLYVLDVIGRQLVRCDLAGGAREVLGENLPVGGPGGVARNYIGGMGALSGPIHNFSGLAVKPDGTVLFAADGAGCVMALRETAH